MASANFLGRLPFFVISPYSYSSRLVGGLVPWVVEGFRIREQIVVTESRALQSDCINSWSSQKRCILVRFY